MAEMAESGNKKEKDLKNLSAFSP